MDIYIFFSSEAKKLFEMSDRKKRKGRNVNIFCTNKCNENKSMI